MNQTCHHLIPHLKRSRNPTWTLARPRATWPPPTTSIYFLFTVRLENARRGEGGTDRWARRGTVRGMSRIKTKLLESFKSQSIVRVTPYNTDRDDNAAARGRRRPPPLRPWRSCRLGASRRSSSRRSPRWSRCTARAPSSTRRGSASRASGTASRPSTAPAQRSSPAPQVGARRSRVGWTRGLSALRS